MITDFLKNNGEVLELAFGKNQSRYDGDTSEHHHFFCLICNRIFDVHFSSQDNLKRKIEKKIGCRITYQRRSFYGYCKDCRGKKLKEKLRIMELNERKK